MHLRVLPTCMIPWKLRAFNFQGAIHGFHPNCIPPITGPPTSDESNDCQWGLTALGNMAQHGTARHSMVQHNTTQHGTAWHGNARYYINTYCKKGDGVREGQLFVNLFFGIPDLKVTRSCSYSLAQPRRLYILSSLTRFVDPVLLWSTF
jgi:hypothetical protein